MTTMNYCRLCVNIGLDFKSLYDENGQPTEVYDLTAKYFHPSILNTDDAKHLSMICLQCWEHIWDFHNFQQAVFVAQSNLGAIKHTEIPPESEELPGTSNLKDLLQTTSSSKENNEDCIYVSESDEESASLPAEEFLNAEDATNVDLTLNEDDTQSDLKYDDPVGIFIGGEFDHLSDCSSQSQKASIDLDNDSNSSLSQFGIRMASESSSASENSSKSPNHGNHKKILYFSQAHPMRVNKQLWMFFNHAQNSCDDEFIKFAANRRFICFVCLEKCLGIEGLFIHSNKCHLNKTVQIICCKRRLEGVPAISKHLTLHYKSPISYLCEACGNTYKTEVILNNHILNAHPGYST